MNTISQITPFFSSASPMPGRTTFGSASDISWSIRTKKGATSKETSLRIATFILQNKLPFPIVPPSDKAQALWDFLALKTVIKTGSSFLAGGADDFEPRYHDLWKTAYNPGRSLCNPFYDTIIARESPMRGARASNFCHYAARVHSRIFGCPTPYEIWHGEDPKLLAKMLRDFVRKTQETEPGFYTFSDKEAKESISSSYLTPSQFPPHVIPALLRTLRNFSQTPNSEKWRVLDPSSGWGDRLIGTLASDAMVSHYVGVDPNPALVSGQERACDLFPSSVQVKHITKCFEDLLPEDLAPFDDALFDLVVTSPPFFVKEIFSADKNQSSSRYLDPNCSLKDNHTSWMVGFLFPMLSKAWSFLKQGGFLAIHMDDISLGKKVDQAFPICDQMNGYIGSVLGGKYLGAIGLSMEKVPSAAWGIRCEPIWVWQKL